MINPYREGNRGSAVYNKEDHNNWIKDSINKKTNNLGHPPQERIQTMQLIGMVN